MRGRLLLAAAAVASHATALAGGFSWLDHGDLEAGAALGAPSGWLSLFAHGFARTGFYRPLTALSLSIDALAGSPLAFHAVALLLHALASVLASAAAEALGLSRRAALFAGLLFAVHPATGLVAGQLAMRADLLAACALFGLVAAQRRGHPWLAAAAIAAGGLCKETVLVLGPLFVLALEAERTRAKPGRAARVAIPLAGLALPLALRLFFAPPWRSAFPPLSFAEAVGTRLAALAKSALAIALPFDRRICDAFPIALPWHPAALAGAAVAAALVALAWKRRGPALLLGLALVPSLGLVPAPRFWSPHYLYLPLGFAAILVAEAFERRGARAFVAGAAACAVFAAVSLVDSSRYRDDTALFGGEVAGRPECREAHLYLGDAMRRSGDLEGAARAYEAAAAPAPGFLAFSDEAAAQQNLGLVRLAQGRHFDAELAFEQALELQPDPLARRQLGHDLAAVAVARGDPAEAARLLAPEVERPDAQPESILLLARALHDMGQDEEARALLSRLPANRP